jgi:hypothetical protein
MKQLIFTVALMAGLATSCGGLPQDGEVEEFDAATLEDLGDKSDRVGGRTVRVRGRIAMGSTKIGDSDVIEGYTFDLTRRTEVSIRVISLGIGVVHLYGPRRADGSWGPLIRKKWWGRFGERILTADLTRAGKYLIVMTGGGGGDRFLSLCKEGLCRQFCGESEDHPTTPGAMKNYMAQNYSSREEWEWRSEPIREYSVNLLLREGSCGEQSRSCSRTRRPVCGTDGRTYDNECQAKVAARVAMGSTWNQGGLGITPGACGR